MANSPSHALGQIIGYAMEQAFYDMLLPVATDFSLYLDRQGPRPARGSKKKVTWTDDNHNTHDLDFVMEKGGTATVVGAPAAFIESAWRRYTKHSKNKAGELVNALVPLRRTYRYHRPFLGAIVAGEWTAGGIAELESQGVIVLHLPLATLVDAFAVGGVDMAFGEDTATEHLAAQVTKWSEIGAAGQSAVVEALRQGAAERFESFAQRLREHLSRTVQSVRILPLRGSVHSSASVSEALAVLSGMATTTPTVDELELLRIEVQVQYSNTDRVEGSFATLADAIVWLEQNYLET